MARRKCSTWNILPAQRLWFASTRGTVPFFKRPKKGTVPSDVPRGTWRTENVPRGTLPAFPGAIRIAPDRAAARRARPDRSGRFTHFHTTELRESSGSPVNQRDSQRKIDFAPACRGFGVWGMPPLSRPRKAASFPRGEAAFGVRQFAAAFAGKTWGRPKRQQAAALPKKAAVAAFKDRHPRLPRISRSSGLDIAAVGRYAGLDKFGADNWNL